MAPFPRLRVPEWRKQAKLGHAHIHSLSATDCDYDQWLPVPALTSPWGWTLTWNFKPNKPHLPLKLFCRVIFYYIIRKETIASCKGGMAWYTWHLKLAALVSEWGTDPARRWSESKVKRNCGGGLSLAWPEQTENHEWVQAAEEVGTVETVGTSMVGLKERQGSHWRCPNIQTNFICPHEHTALARQQLEGTRMKSFFEMDCWIYPERGLHSQRKTARLCPKFEAVLL